MNDSLMARLRGDRRDEGFTLIELLIVIVILGVLAAIVVFSVTGVQNNSKVAACKADIKSMDTALEAYYAQNNTGATSLDQLVTAGFLHADSTIAGTTKTVKDGSGNTIYLLTESPVGSSTKAGDIIVTTNNTGGTCP